MIPSVMTIKYPIPNKQGTLETQNISTLLDKNILKWNHFEHVRKKYSKFYLKYRVFFKKCEVTPQWQRFSSLKKVSLQKKLKLSSNISRYLHVGEFFLMTIDTSLLILHISVVSFIILDR